MCCASWVPTRDKCGKVSNALLIGLHYASQPDQVIRHVGLVPRVRAIVRVGVVMAVRVRSWTRPYRGTCREARQASYQLSVLSSCS